MRILKEDSILIVVDFQDKLLSHMYNVEDLKKKVTALIRGIKLFDIPIIATQQYTKGLGYTDSDISVALGYENPENLPFVEKNTFSCFDSESFKDSLAKWRRKNVIICGIEGHVCVMQTIIDLKSAGYNPVPVLDCISSRKEKDYQNGLKRYAAEGVTPSCFESILFELCRSSKAPVFKEISAIVK